MSPQENPGAMSKLAQSYFFGFLAFIFLATFITLRACKVELETHETFFLIFGTYACMDVLSGRGLVAQMVQLFQFIKSNQPNDKNIDPPG